MKLTAQSLVVFRVSSTGVRGAIQFKPEEWQVFSLMDGKRNIAEVAQALGLDPGIVWRTAKSLYQLGVLEPAPGFELPSEVIEDKFFQVLTSELVKILGAVSDIIIDEEVSELGESRERFPKDRAPELVERVSLSIRNEQKRLKFQHVMLEWLLRA